MKNLVKLLWVALFLMGSAGAFATDFSLNPARDFGAIRRINPTDYDGLAVVRETGAGLSSDTSEAFRAALEVFSKAHVQSNYVATSTLDAHITDNSDVHGCTVIASASAVADALSAANASDALNLRLDGTATMTGNLRLGGKWLSNDGGNEGLQVSDGGNVLIGTTSDDGTNKLQVNGATKIGGNINIVGDQSHTNATGAGRKIFVFSPASVAGNGVATFTFQCSTTAADVVCRITTAGTRSNSTLGASKEDLVSFRLANNSIPGGTYSVTNIFTKCDYPQIFTTSVAAVGSNNRFNVLFTSTYGSTWYPSVLVFEFYTDDSITVIASH